LAARVGAATQRWLHRHYRGIDAGFEICSLKEQAKGLRAENLEARYAAARAQVERLTPALLAKAFRGELVHPGPEPASVLLEHIHAARAAASVKPRRATRSPVLEGVTKGQVRGGR
jgi:hypothetical protein